MLKSSSLSFLKSLSKNNTKVWFDAHRNDFIDTKNDFENFLAALIKKTASFDDDVKSLTIKDCTFRINRDVRFAKDKSPYKTNMGASLNRGGKKSIYAGYYFHLEPGDKSFAGGGIWMPPANELKKVRQEIDYGYDEFIKIISDKKFKTEYSHLETSADVKLTNLPRGYDKTNPAVEYLKLKSLLAMKLIKDSDMTNLSLVNQVSGAFKALMPLIKFINKAME